MSTNSENQLEITDITERSKKDKDEDINDSVLFQPSLTVLDESGADNVVKDITKNKDLFFGNVDQNKPNPWKVGNTLTLCYNSENDPLITIGPHCK